MMKKEEEEEKKKTNKDCEGHHCLMLSTLLHIHAEKNTKPFSFNNLNIVNRCA